MININKKTSKNIFILLITSIATLTFNITQVKAGPINNVIVTYDDNDGASGTGGAPTAPGLSYDCGDGLTATCWQKQSYSDWSTIGVDAYDMYGNEIPNVFNMNRNILAGTYIGLNVYEKKGYSIKVTSGATGIQKMASCVRYGPVSPCLEMDEHTMQCTQWTWGEKERTEEINDCPGGYTKIETYYKWADACGAAKAYCQSLAKPTPKPITPSYKVSYENSNTTDLYDTADEIEGSIINQSLIDEEESADTWYLEQEKIFYYNREKTCINVKTGNVKYIGKDESCNSSTDNNNYEVTAKNGYWNYFVPLNTTSNTGFKIELNPVSEDSTLGKRLCKETVETNPNYMNVIRPMAGSFNGNKIHDKNLVESEDCQYISIITIPIEQKFYNELNGTKLKGFNFYYKPIDINNPFPNGLPTNSIWTQTDIDKLTGTSMDKDDITYIANVTNASAIRNYKDDMIKHGDYLYTRWDNMYVNGISNFVEKSGFVKRYADKSDIYKLGCGPANENPTNSDGTKNYLYRQECDT